jgi:hypothetical protein
MATQGRRVTFRLVPVDPEDLLDAAKTIATGEVSCCHWLTDWVQPATFLEWARRGLQEGDERGLSDAITYAKRSAACRIDTLTLYNHLAVLARAKYPVKIEALRELGIDALDVVQELVFEPRNDLEHAYQTPRLAAARHAVDVAELFLKVTEAEYQRASIVAVHWNLMCSFSSSTQMEFHGFADHPMLFVDVFDKTPRAGIVDPVHGETRAADLPRFTKEQAITLARILRGNYPAPSVSVREVGFYRILKMFVGF